MAESKKLTSDDFAVKHTFKVRFKDCDQMRHVNNAIYITYLEEARFHYFNAMGLNVSSEEGDLNFIIAEINCKYLSPAVFEEEMEANIRVAGIGKSKYQFEYLLVSRADGRAVASATSMQVGFDYEKGKVSRLPEGFKAQVEKLEGREIPSL